MVALVSLFYLLYQQSVLVLVQESDVFLQLLVERGHFFRGQIKRFGQLLPNS